MTAVIDERPAPPALAGVPGTPRLNAALAAVQAEMPPIAKGERANAGTYSYSYADLAGITAVAYPILGKHGLAFSAQPTLDDGKFVLRYQLLHESGEALTGMMLLPSSGKPQDLGGVITYFKRYAFCAVTGISPGGDDDDSQSSNHEQRFDRPRSAGDAWETATPASPRDRRPQQPRPEPQRPAVTVPPLDDEDPWKAKIADIADAPEGAAVRAEVAELLEAGKITQERASRLNAVITVRAVDLAAAQGAPRPGRRAEQAAVPPIRAEDQGARKPAQAAAADDGEWVKGFYVRLADADEDGLTAMQREVGRAVAERKIQPDTSAELSADIRKRRNALRGEPVPA